MNQSNATLSEKYAHIQFDNQNAFVNMVKELAKSSIAGKQEKRGLLGWMRYHLWTMVGLLFVPTKGIRGNLSLLLVPIRFLVPLKPL